ncbi:MAG: DUF3883 domain-containing protein, partial [Acidimicrobiia bacterium]|nr:DUF3883 domain-containing protein [Acidimicrobiia bacterium]
MRLEGLVPGTVVDGLVVGERATVVAVDWHGAGTVQVVYRTSQGVAERLLSRDDEARLSVATADRPWTLDAPGHAFKLASEALRIHLAHLFDPYLAVQGSNIDPLPHQIEAVYQEMLPRQPLRFLLADDPGAGKTIMSGLLIRELDIRGDADRVLIVAPGSLVEQWQEELHNRFHLSFDIFSRDMVEAALAGNPFKERPRLIARLDQLARNEELQERLKASEWDLVVVDEAHKMSAHLYGRKLEKTKRYRVGEILRGITRHFLLLTATPHNGKEEEFHLFLALLDPDRFEGRLKGEDIPDYSDVMRRYIKEKLLTFDGRRLFPERFAISAKYELSEPEQELYEAVTSYVREGMYRAKQMEEGGDRRRGLAVGFALAALQRRLASSPQAIHRSLERRRDRLEKRLGEMRDIAEGKVTPGTFAKSGVNFDDFDFDDFRDDELEQIEDEVIDQETAALTVPELEKEISQLTELVKQAAALRNLKTDRKWEQLRAIFDSEEMTSTNGASRKIIIFTEHRDTLDYLLGRIGTLIGRPEAVGSIHGGMKRQDRRSMQHAFVNDPNLIVLVATDAAGEGVNLQRANLMVNYDLPWNPNRIEQRFGRIHRIGQTEVCYLWNLVAHQTREGAVFHRLFEKIEQQRQALGGQVYDVLGDSMIGKSLRELLIEAIRYGDDPQVKARRDEVIDADVGARLQDLVEHQQLTEGWMGLDKLSGIRDEMERARMRKLQPGFIQAFFIDAFRLLGGRIPEREKNRFQITRVPQVLRADPLTTVAREYERVTFEPGLETLEGKPPAEVLSPGHPLLEVVIAAIRAQYGAFLQTGAVLVDPDDPGTTPRVMVYLEHRITDGKPERNGRRSVSRRYQYIEIPKGGEPSSVGQAPYLDYRPIRDEERAMAEKVAAGEWITTALTNTARSYAIEHLAQVHYQEVSGIVTNRVQKVRTAVRERLEKEIRYWDGRVHTLKTKELAGKSTGGFTSGHARNFADDLEARLDRRNRELDQELDLSNHPPAVVGGALIVPQGMLEVENPALSVDQESRDRVDQRAVAAVMAAERRLGREPTEMEHHNPGFDIESRCPATGDLYFIEVKGRIEGADTVNVKSRQIRQGLNHPDRFILAVVQVPPDGAGEP